MWDDFFARRETKLLRANYAERHYTGFPKRELLSLIESVWKTCPGASWFKREPLVNRCEYIMVICRVYLCNQKIWILFHQKWDRVNNTSEYAERKDAHVLYIEPNNHLTVQELCDGIKQFAKLAEREYNETGQYIRYCLGYARRKVRKLRRKRSNHPRNHPTKFSS